MNNKTYQIACNWSLTRVALNLLSMNLQTFSNSSLAPDSKPWESWKIKLLPGYVIWCSISWIPRYNLLHLIHHLFSWVHSPPLMVSNVLQKEPIVDLKQWIHINGWGFGLLTILVINDRLCPTFYTTDLLKNCCFACIGPSYDKNPKMGTFVLFPKHFDVYNIPHESVSARHKSLLYFDIPNTCESAVSAIVLPTIGW